MPENAQYFEKLGISEEVVNGTKCVLLDLIHFSGEEMKYYICKETGFVIKQEIYAAKPGERNQKSVLYQVRLFF